MELTCTHCGKKFEWKRHRQTCSDVCAKARQKASIEQMRAGSGEIFERWKEAIDIGMAMKRARRRIGREQAKKRKKGVI